MLLARGWRRSTLIAIACASMALIALLIFRSGAPAMTIFLLCVAFSAVGGLIPATLLGSAPLLAPRPALAAASVGLVMQGSNLGQVIGPVTVGAVIDRHGWPSAAWVVVAAGAGGLLIAWGCAAWAGARRTRRGSSVLSRRALTRSPVLAATGFHQFPRGLHNYPYCELLSTIWIKICP